MKKLLLIEANGNAGEDLLDAACALGAEVYVATHEDLYDKYASGIKAKITGTVFTDFRDFDLARRDLVAFADQTGIDGVVTGWEFFSSVVTWVTNDLGLPGHDPRGAEACRNKALMAAVFADYGVPSPRTIAATTQEGLLDRIEAVGLDFPLVVKPADNAGSIGVSVVYTADELAKAFEFAKGWPLEFPHGTPLDPVVVIQEYIGGTEFSVESVIADGRITHLAVTQKFTTAGASRAELGHTVPAELADSDRMTILDVVEQAQAALGLRNGISHTEIKLVEPGVAKIIELGARPPGDCIMKLVKDATGVNEAAAYIQVAFGEEPDVTAKVQRAAAIRFLTSPQAGVFKGIVGVPNLADMVTTVVYAEPGKVLGDPIDNVARVGYVILRADSPANVNELAVDVLDTLTIEVEPA